MLIKTGTQEIRRFAIPFHCTLKVQ